MCVSYHNVYYTLSAAYLQSFFPLFNVRHWFGTRPGDTKIRHRIRKCVGRQQNWFCLNKSESRKGRMGYSNKRRRSKRRRTRTLTALQNHTDLPVHESSSSQSSRDVLEQHSSSASFPSTHSHDHSYMNGDACIIPPSSIFLDDVTNINAPDNSFHDEIQLNDSEDDLFSIEDNDSVDQFLNYQDPPVDDMSIEVDDDPSLRSATSSLENGNPAQHQHHYFDRMTRDETASYKIMSLLDTSGAPRICYDRLVALLKKLSRQEGFDVKKALNRETLMRRMEKRYKSPRIQSSVIHNQEVFRFNFQDTLQDLLHSSSKHLHEILPKQMQDKAIENGTEHELWNTPWMTNTFATEQFLDFDPKKDIMLPIILYMDKTGTDVNQRYSLEPVLFSIAAIPREHRESRHSWRHLGFVPEKQRCSEEEESSDLQFYHDCLSYLLDGLRAAQKNPPNVMVKLSDHDTP